MASIFLSYAHQDKAKAEALANALEHAGHDVWWDSHVRGGSEYAGEIEAALARADHVVVLWSKTSVKSAWVRDEASEGLDSGRLLPVLLNSSRPPMGFRQVQAIDLSRWNGKNPSSLAPLLDAVGGTATPRQPAARRTRQRPRFTVPAAILAALLAVTAGVWYAFDRWGAANARTPTIAVLPFADLSPQGDKAYLAEGVGEAILSMLAREAGVSVIGRTSAAQFRETPNDLQRMRKVLGVTHVLEGSARTAGGQLRMSVRLVDAADGKQLWAEEYQRPVSNIFAVQDEIAGAVANRLKGTLSKSVRSAARPDATVDNYTLYLAARAKMRSRKQKSLTEALQLGRQLTRSDPNYAAAYALQAETLWLLSDFLYGNVPRDTAARMAQPLAEKAIRLAPNAPEGYAALGGVRLFREPATAIEPLRRALALDPSRSDVRLWLALAYGGAGRNVEAFREYQAAEAMDPLSPGVILAYVPALAGGGHFDQARAVINAYEQRGGFRGEALRLRANLFLAQGDFSQAVKLTNQALAIDRDTLRTRKALAGVYFMLGLHDQAARISGDMPLFTRLRITGREEELVRTVRRLGPRVWQEPHVDLAFNALMRKRDWGAIVAAFDANPDYSRVLCGGFEFQITLPSIMALRAAGRSEEAARLLRCENQWAANANRGPVGQSGISLASVNAIKAQLLAVGGQETQAFAMYNKAVDDGFRTAFGHGLSQLPAFDAYRANPEYAALDARLKQLIAREREEVLRDSP